MALQIATPLRAFATCSNSATRRGSRAFTSVARDSVDSFSDDSVDASSCCSVFFPASISFDCAARVASASLDAAFELVGFQHALQHLFFDRSEVALGRGDLVLHRLILAVGLDRHQLILELRQAALIQRDILFEIASSIVIHLELLYERFGGPLGFVESRIERREFWGCCVMAALASAMMVSRRWSWMRRSRSGSITECRMQNSECRTHVGLS